MEKGKGLGFKWFNFLYGWFVFRIIMDSLGVLNSFVQIKGYESMYGSTDGINSLVYWIIFSAIVSAVLKLIAVLTKHKESGYAAVNVVLVWDLIYWFIWGFQYDWFGAIFAPLLVSTFIVPTFFYIRKRKFVYGIVDDRNDQETIVETDTDKIKFCRKCGEKLINNSRFCRRCGTEIVEEPSVSIPELDAWEFCKNCGANVINDIDTCHVCGEQKGND